MICIISLFNESLFNILSTLGDNDGNDGNDDDDDGNDNDDIIEDDIILHNDDCVGNVFLILILVFNCHEAVEPIIIINNIIFKQFIF